MEKNPLEQQQNTDISAISIELKEELGRNFDNKQELNDRIDNLTLKMNLLQKNGAVFNKEKIIEDVKGCININEKEAFITHLLKALEPILVLRTTQPEIFERTQREAQLYNSGYLKLSEVLHFGLDGEEVQLHLAPATELIKDAGIGNFKKEVENGLRKLAEFIKSNDTIKEITATSWIVAKNPMLLERLGFTVGGEIPKEEKEKLFSAEKRPIAKAFMGREEFLARYGKE